MPGIFDPLSCGLPGPSRLVEDLQAASIGPPCFFNLAAQFSHSADELPGGNAQRVNLEAFPDQDFGTLELAVV